ncbi:MAG TPA: hybrid sensor histidine kinase/response regulator [Candidatus Angelobacter sp.]|nr:hybrid sensor histidine kinase/response regulator [Candidatus Angelobacter sp.]
MSAHTLRQWIPEFADHGREQLFRARHYQESIRYARVVLTVGCITALPSILNDYLFWSLNTKFYVLLALRAVVVVGLTLGMIFLVKHLQRPVALDWWMFAWLVAFILQSAVVAGLRPRGFALDALSWQLIVLASYLFTPLRYFHRLICGIGATILYLAVILAIRSIVTGELGSVVGALILTNLVGMSTIFQIERLRRLEYAHLMEEQTANVKLSAEIQERERLVIALRNAKLMAEESNLAKSRFLAAASHDLRQPVHALGMFVGALRARPLDSEGRKIVDHIDDSIHAMSELFTGLLDVSRLDAGVVQPCLQTFCVQTLLERIYHQFLEPGRRKGLCLTLHPCSLFVCSDPVLLERILRNIVANAVQYSDSGRIAMGCRRRGGGLSVQIWDMGRGIALEHQELIFQEFYQIGNDERDRSKGMGLGLAIVKRLTTLLQTPLHFSSQLGKGSMFAVEVALASAASYIPTVEQESKSAGPMQGLVLVVDDEIAIQQAMRSLLISWGFSVIVAGSGREILEAVAGCDTRPSLILCDYRLRDAERGIDVIQRLRSEFNEEIPSVLVSGDTAPDRLKEAQDSGLILLHKPVPNGKLRATITSLIQARETASA